MVHTLVLLESVPYPTGFFICDLCREKGSGSVFHCSACHFDLHPSCIATSEQISHFSHYNHALHIENLDTNKVHTCDVCGDPAFPTVYHCDDCEFDMHPHCARAPRFIHHTFHKHILQLRLKKDVYSGCCWCDICGKEAFNSIYHCSSCKFDVHISCAMLPCNPYNSKHPEHRLKLLSKISRKASCVECGKEASRWAYGCESCGFYLHVDCANIPRHEVAALPTSALGDSTSLATASDIKTVVKMMDRLLISSAESVSSTEGAAARRVMKMLEQQQHGVPVSLSPSVSMLTRDGDRNTCPTCLEEYASEKQRKSLRCGHHFHTGCILRWLDNSNRCPVCRREVMFIDGP
ncbi:hypothetical protein KP509_18G071100 [Ceratopteris richardii]|uniref:RING-type domain-containing protein n=1 Tax=Ceratopteris richardii TaxID=49495 RepID=A0A8T2SQM5_CERRI|nr:hypothetical protein KP509_18G071100 [Ceratopteris richardii]